ncbi:MAG TPA: hypothetical protein VF210_08055 [Pseudomonadales bacterium]
MRKRRIRHYDDPLRHPDHPRPRTRREFLAQGFIAGSAAVVGSTSLLLGGKVRAQLSPDLLALIENNVLQNCEVTGDGPFRIPFICFDLAGGSSQAGSNVLVGQRGGQLDFLTTAGYERQGLPGDMVPPIANPATGTNDFIDQTLGLAFHSDSAFLRGIMSRISPGTAANINGAVIPARSENDTGNNPHNPMYGIAKVGGANGELVTLIGSSNSDSGGNSMAPLEMIDLTIRPTKVDRPTDVTGLVDVGDLTAVLAKVDAVKVMESIYRLSDMKVQRMENGQAVITANDVVRDLVRCGYLKSAYLADAFADPASLNPLLDTDIVGPGGIFSADELQSGSSANEYRKTASVMKMVINRYAGAGTIEMGGYDYHGGRRAEGEIKDFRAGECMGACLEYAARRNMPLMLYVTSDGSLSSDGTIDDTEAGRGKGEWTSDNSSTAAPFFLVYNPGGPPALRGATDDERARHQQIGHMRPDGSVETAATPAAGNVNLLAQTIVLNYLALHGLEGNFSSAYLQAFGLNHGLGNAAMQDSLIAFQSIL